jgi:hypothetical protein
MCVCDPVSALGIEVVCLILGFQQLLESGIKSHLKILEIYTFSWKFCNYALTVIYQYCNN